MLRLRFIHMLFASMALFAVMGTSRAYPQGQIGKSFDIRTSELLVEISHLVRDLANLALKTSGTRDGDSATQSFCMLYEPRYIASYLVDAILVRRWIRADYLGRYDLHVRTELKHHKEVLDLCMQKLDIQYSMPQSVQLVILLDRARSKVRELVSLLDEYDK